MKINQIYMTSFYFSLFLFALFLLTLFLPKIARSLKIIDKPDDARKIHSKPTPALGGLILYSSIIFHFIFDQILIFEYKFSETFIIIFCSTIFFLIGFLDDQKGLGPIQKTTFIIFTLLIILPLNENFIIDVLNFKYFISYPVLLQNASLFFTIFCIYAFFNAFNFIDGVDGLSISYGIFLLIFISYFSNYTDKLYFTLILSLIFCLILNLNKKIFLGNSGASLFSIILSLLLILNYNKFQKIYADEILILFLIPGIDMIRVIFERLFIKKTKIFMPDNLHFHHLLMRKFPVNLIWMIFILICLLPIIIYLIFSNTFYGLFVGLLIYSLSIVYLKKCKEKK